MIKNLTFNRILFLITGLLSLIASVWGVLDPGMYEPVVGARQLPGVFTQDLVVILAGLMMIVLSLLVKEDSYRSVIVIYGILGFLFYAYGIYAIEQVYTMLYPLYLGILGLSFYVLIYSLASLNFGTIEALKLPTAIRYGASGYGVFIAIMFNIISLLGLTSVLF
jgi:multisubunit Na+/H+ antiporter MnhF subunit